MSDSFNSDDERYADDTFEQDSDTDIPEVAEIESEVSDEDDDDRLPSVKLNTGPIKPPMNYGNTLGPNNNTDAVPFDSSSDEEDDVIVGQTLVEINTPSMHFLEDQSEDHTSRTQQHATSPVHSDSSVSEEDSEEEREFQRIRDMEERYIQQNSANTPTTGTELDNKVSPSDHSDGQETETETEVEADIYDNNDTILLVEEKTQLEEQRRESRQSLKSTQSVLAESVHDPIPELIEKVKEQFTPEPQVPQPMQTNFMEIIQNSLSSLIQGSKAHQPDSAEANKGTNDGASNFPANHMLNPENIATALITAMSSTCAAQYQTAQVQQTVCTEELNSSGAHSVEKSTEDTHSIKPNTNNGEQEVEIEHTSPPSVVNGDDDNYDSESYYHGQFEYEITSKPPSCFNSEDYVFHTNFIRPSATTDKLRPRPQPRKSMSFSNERMREIERHNQILLRKILTQKPTYASKTTQPKVQSIKPNNHSSNGRMTTSAVNRKKQQRQIDMDNQVLKRKIEAISLRRRPLISS